MPGRDDIRFDIAVTSGEEAEFHGRAPNGAPEGVRMESTTANTSVARDVAPRTKGGSEYRVELPVAGDGVVRIELQPKRYCFEEPDRRPFAYAQPNVTEVELDCV